MTTPEFNLLDEPWIRVIKPDYTEEEVSLTDAILRAHEFKNLCGELVTQDVSILRLMLAVLHTVWSRMDTNGIEDPLDSAQDAEERWEALWNYGKFPARPIRGYLERWHERFWLFHKERPFGQVSEVPGTQFGAKKLNASISESNNTVRLFSDRSGEGKHMLSYAESARWLIHINVFDDGAAKKSSERDKDVELPPLELGYLGKLGVITAQGKNLFQTLMLNLTLLKDGTEEWSEDNQPIWEKDKIHTAERINIAMPQNQAELLTVPFRRIKLERNDGSVTGYTLLGGDFFDTKNGFAEQMTVWMKPKVSKGEVEHYIPKRHDPSKQMWREFAAYFSYEAGIKPPGVVNWTHYLMKQRIIPYEMITFQICSLQYNLGQAASKPIQDYFADALTFHIDLLTEVGSGWRIRIKDEINRCDQLARCVGELKDDLTKAAGKDSESGHLADVRAHLYDRLDLPFRKWLCDIDPKIIGTKMEEKIDYWHKIAQSTALQLGRELVDAAGEKAFVGRYIEEGSPKRRVSTHYSSSEAYNRFRVAVKKITSREGLKWQKK